MSSALALIGAQTLWKYQCVAPEDGRLLQDVHCAPSHYSFKCCRRQLEWDGQEAIAEYQERACGRVACYVLHSLVALKAEQGDVPEVGCALVHPENLQHLFMPLLHLRHLYHGRSPRQG